MEIYQSLSTEMSELETWIQNEFRWEFPFISELMEHISQYRGKRLRPVLTFLAARCFKGVTPDHVPLAGIVEMIHTATLVHDDVIDEADIRRKVPTVNTKWTNEVAVLLGDFLFSHAFHLSLRLSTPRGAEVLSATTNTMVGGELLQVEGRNNLDLTEPYYYDIIGMKTAALTAAASQLGAEYAGATPEQGKAFFDYGYNLGIAFQIVDDYLDLMGDESKVGKSLGTDLQKGKMTLPMIRLVAVASSEDRARIAAMVKSAESGAIDNELRRLLEEYGAVRYAFEKAQSFVDAAVAAVDFLPESNHKDVLRALAGFVLARNH